MFKSLITALCLIPFLSYGYSDTVDEIFQNAQAQRKIPNCQKTSVLNDIASSLDNGNSESIVLENVIRMCRRNEKSSKGSIFNQWYRPSFQTHSHPRI